MRSLKINATFEGEDNITLGETDISCTVDDLVKVFSYLISQANNQYSPNDVRLAIYLALGIEFERND